jgi:hypothetical protein
VKSGLSMINKASGRAAAIARAVCPIRNRSFGRFARTCEKPMIDSSE